MPIETRTINVVPVSGIYTAATAVRGGVTTYSAGHPRGGQRRTSDNPNSPDYKGTVCGGCVGNYVWDPSVNGGDGGWVCSVCGCELMDVSEGHCDCGEDCHCVPLTDGWQVWLMMALLAVAYAVRRNRKITQQAYFSRLAHLRR